MLFMKNRKITAATIVENPLLELMDFAGTMKTFMKNQVMKVMNIKPVIVQVVVNYTYDCKHDESLSPSCAGGAHCWLRGALDHPA